MNRMNVLNIIIYVILCFVTVDLQFINPPPNEEVECTGSAALFNWTYGTSSPVLAVEWKVNGTSIATEIVQANQPFTPSGSYASRLTKISNAQISLASVNPNDYGEFTCEISYTSGQGYASNPITLFVYDFISGSLSISKSVTGNLVTLTSSITDQDTSYEWTYAGKIVGTKSTYHATRNGEYTLTLGNRGKCLSPGPSVASVDVKEIARCTGAFYCACPILIAVVSTIIICILMRKEVTKKIGGFSNEEIKIIVIFSVVAISVLPIGLGLGLGLREGTEKCLNCEVTIGISIALGIVLSLVQFSFVYYWNHKKGPIAKDSKGSPTSASEVKVQTEKSSHSNSAEKSTDLKKPLPRPLPIPMGRNNQLEPLQKPDNGEVERSAPEKKKKKKKKRKREEASVENEEEN